MNTNWYEVVLDRKYQDICSARTTQSAQDIWVLYCIVWRFAWIRNRQYRQLRRLCCEILIRSVFTLPEPYSALATVYFSAAAPSLQHALLLQYRHWTLVVVVAVVPSSVDVVVCSAFLVLESAELGMCWGILFRSGCEGWGVHRGKPAPRITHNRFRLIVKAKLY